MGHYIVTVAVGEYATRAIDMIAANAAQAADMAWARAMRDTTALAFQVRVIEVVQTDRPGPMPVAPRPAFAVA